MPYLGENVHTMVRDCLQEPATITKRRQVKGMLNNLGSLHNVSNNFTRKYAKINLFTISADITELARVGEIKIIF